MSATHVRRELVARREIALIDLRDEAAFALGHPLFASQIPVRRLAIEAPYRIPRRSCPVILYDGGGELVASGAQVLAELGYTRVGCLDGGLQGWQQGGFESFQDVNSYSKAFGELVEHRRHTPSLAAEQVKALLDGDDHAVVLDVRRFDEYATMSIPGAVSVPGAELVLRARVLAPDPKTRIIVNCAGRTRSLIGAQSLINAGVPNRVDALRNGTIGWMLAGQTLAHGQAGCFSEVSDAALDQARANAREVSYRAGVCHIDLETFDDMRSDRERTLYCFDVRTDQEYASGHHPAFLHVPGGQLVQEIDMAAPVRGAGIVLADALGPRADMTASWLAQMGWKTYVLEHSADQPLETGSNDIPARDNEGRYRRPYEGTSHSAAAMQAYLDWENGLVAQLARDASHGFFVI